MESFGPLKVRFEGKTQKDMAGDGMLYSKIEVGLGKSPKKAKGEEEKEKNTLFQPSGGRQKLEISTAYT